MSQPTNVASNAPIVDSLPAGRAKDTKNDVKLGGNSDTSISQPQVFGPQQTPAVQSDLPPRRGSANGLNFGHTSIPNTDTNLPKEPKKKLPRAKLLLVLVALLIFGLGSGAFAYVNVLNNSPEKVLADALANTMRDVLDRRPLQVVSNIKLKSKDSKNPYEISLDLDAVHVENDGKLSVKGQFTTQEPKLDISISSDLVVQDDKTVYVRLNDLQKSIDKVGSTVPVYAMMAKMYQPIIEKIDGKWIKIDAESLAKMGLQQSAEETNKCSEAFTNLRISSKDSKRVKEIFKQNQFAIASEVLPAESVDGDKSFHYKLDLNKEAGARFVKELATLDSFKDVKQECKVKQEDLDKSLKKIEEGKEKSNTKPIIELWVSKKTRHITRTLIKVDDKEAEFTMSANAKIDARNLSVEVPKDSIKIEDLKAEFESAMQKALLQAEEEAYSRHTTSPTLSPGILPEDEQILEQRFRSGDLQIDTEDWESQL